MTVISDSAERLEKIFEDLMPEETLAVRKRTRVNMLAWDSLFQLNLILAIEQEFGFTISDDEAVDIQSFESALSVIDEHGAAGHERTPPGRP